MITATRRKGVYRPKWTESQKKWRYLVRNIGKGGNRFGGRVVRSFAALEEGLAFMQTIQDAGTYELRFRVDRYNEEVIATWNSQAK